jgi:putative Mn2+ efflux pump MntP
MGVWGSTAVIGTVTCGLSIAAVFIGKKVGNKLADKAGLLGGIVLLAIGIKILIEGLI